MGEIVLAAAASHAPGITGYPDRAGEQGSRFMAGMEQIHQAFEEAQPDVIIEICNEHFVNFHVNNMPALCIGTGEYNVGPMEPEAWLHIPRTNVPGHPEFANAIVKEAYNAGFDLSFSERLLLDHGTVVPLHFFTPNMDIPVIPILVNSIAEPMPLPQRMYRLGKLISQVIATRPKGERVAVIGTGGISHWVGTPEMGRINVDFDERFLESIERGQGEAIADWTPEQIGQGGNGAHEIRNWIAVMGAVADAKGEVTTYEPVVEWVTGSGAVIWKL